jgi:hypothetical protein
MKTIMNVWIDDDIENGQAPLTRSMSGAIVQTINNSNKTTLQRTPSLRSNSSHSDRDSSHRGGDDSETEQLIKETQQPTTYSPSSSPSSASSSSTKALVACINYCFCSVSMILVNKSLASRYRFLENVFDFRSFC